MIVEVHRVRAQMIEGGGETVVGFLSEGHEISACRSQCAVNAGGENQAVPFGKKHFPEIDLRVVFRGCVVRTGNDDVRQIFPDPCRHIHTGGKRFLHTGRNADRDPERMPPFFPGRIRQRARISHEFRQDVFVPFVGSGAEEGNRTEPVQFDPVGFIVEEIFLQEGQMIIENFLLRVIKCIVMPVAAPGVAVPGADEVLAFLPEISVLGEVFRLHGGVMHVVHTHAVPHFHASLPAEPITQTHEGGNVFMKKKSVEYQILIGVVRPLPAEKEIAVGIQRTVLPDRGEDFAREECALEIHVVEYGFHTSGGGVEIHIVADPLFGHLFRGTEEEVPDI